MVCVKDCKHLVVDQDGLLAVLDKVLGHTGLANFRSWARRSVFLLLSSTCREASRSSLVNLAICFCLACRYGGRYGGRLVSDSRRPCRCMASKCQAVGQSLSWRKALGRTYLPVATEEQKQHCDGSNVDSYSLQI